MTDLTKTIRSMFTIPEELRDIHNRKSAAAPNTWYKHADNPSGPEHDYEVLDHGSIQILNPVSEGAIEWCAAHLPANCPRWGVNGYVIEPRYIGPILEGMHNANLLSEEEYNNLCEIEQQQQDQSSQADQDFAEYGEDV